MLDAKSTFDAARPGARHDPGAGRADPRQRASTATSRRRCRARRSTWRWSSCTSCTSTAASTSSSSTRRRRATPSTSSKRPTAWPGLLDNRFFRLLMAPTRGCRCGRPASRCGVPADHLAGRRLARWSTTRARSSGRSRAWSRASGTGRSAVSQLLASDDAAFVLVTSPARRRRRGGALLRRSPGRRGTRDRRPHREPPAAVVRPRAREVGALAGRGRRRVSPGNGDGDAWPPRSASSARWRRRRPPNGRWWRRSSSGPAPRPSPRCPCSPARSPTSPRWRRWAPTSSDLRARPSARRLRVASRRADGRRVA